MYALLSGGYPSFMEILVILVIALLLFGNRLPQMARSLGKGLREFKSGVKGVTQEFESAAEEAEAKPEELPDVAKDDGSASHQKDETKVEA